MLELPALEALGLLRVAVVAGDGELAADRLVRCVAVRAGRHVGAEAARGRAVRAVCRGRRVVRLAGGAVRVGGRGRAGVGVRRAARRCERIAGGREVVARRGRRFVRATVAVHQRRCLRTAGGRDAGVRSAATRVDLSRTAGAEASLLSGRGATSECRSREQTSQRECKCDFLHGESPNG